MISTSTTPTNARAGTLRLLLTQRFVSPLCLATLAARQEYTGTVDGLLTRLKQDIASEGLENDPVARLVDTPEFRKDLVFSLTRLHMYHPLRRYQASAQMEPRIYRGLTWCTPISHLRLPALENMKKQYPDKHSRSYSKSAAWSSPASSPFRFSPASSMTTRRQVTSGRPATFYNAALPSTPSPTLPRKRRADEALVENLTSPSRASALFGVGHAFPSTPAIECRPADIAGREQLMKESTANRSSSLQTFTIRDTGASTIRRPAVKLCRPRNDRRKPARAMASARLAPLDPFAIKPAQPHADQVVGLPNSGRAPQGIAPAKKRPRTRKTQPIHVQGKGRKWLKVFTKVAALTGIGACFYFGNRRVVDYTFGSVGGPAVSGISELPPIVLDRPIVPEVTPAPFTAVYIADQREAWNARSMNARACLAVQSGEVSGASTASLSFCHIVPLPAPRETSATGWRDIVAEAVLTVQQSTDIIRDGLTESLFPNTRYYEDVFWFAELER